MLQALSDSTDITAPTVMRYHERSEWYLIKDIITILLFYLIISTHDLRMGMRIRTGLLRYGTVPTVTCHM